METTLRTLGPSEAKVVLSLREQGRDVVETADIIGLLGSKQTTRKVIRNLVRKGWLARLIGGRYMLLPPERGAENIGENDPLAIASAVVESFVGWGLLPLSTASRRKTCDRHCRCAAANGGADYRGHGH